MSLTALGISALKGGFSLLGNLLGFGSNQATNAANRKLMDHQYDLNLDMWNRNNAYNDPSAQMSRLHAAGLNPNLVYGSGAAGNASSMPDSVKPIPQNSYQQFGSLGVGDAVDSYIATKRFEIEQDLADADYRLKDQEWQINDTKRKINEIELLKEQYVTASTEEEKSIYQQMIDLNLTSLKNQNIIEGFEVSAKSYEVQQIQLAMDKVQAEIDKLIADTDLSKAQKQAVSADIAYKMSMIRLNNANASAQEFQNEIDRQMKPLLVQYGISPTGNDWQRAGYTIFKLLDSPQVKDAANKLGSYFGQKSLGDRIGNFFKQSMGNYGKNINNYHGSRR